jgi:acyl carrier protein
MEHRIEAMIVSFIREELVEANEADALDLDENLFASGLIDSVGIVRLIAYLQGQLGVNVPPPDLVPDNFRTVRRMATYMRGLAGA